MIHHPSPIIATGTLDPVELDVCAYRDEWTKKRDKALKRNGWKDARIAQQHIDVAAAKLVEIASQCAPEGGRG